MMNLIRQFAIAFFCGTHKTTPRGPHITDRFNISRYMSLVVIALLPCTIAGIYFYGLRVIAIIAISYFAGGLTEVIFATARKKPLSEGFLVTGLIFALILPSTIPLWMVAVGSAFGVFFGKEIFGGTGRNIFNPALVGRVFLRIAFPDQFTSVWQMPLVKGIGGFVTYTADAITAATPLMSFKATQQVTGIWQVLSGTTPGCIGQPLGILIVVGGLFLIALKLIDWRIPLSYLLSAGIIALVMNILMPDKFAPPIFQLVSGGLLFGAFFMATEPVSAPLLLEARWIYGILLGILTIMIRGLSGYAEGVMFSILLMNAFAPLLDSLVIDFRFRKLSVEPSEQ